MPRSLEREVLPRTVRTGSSSASAQTAELFLCLQGVPAAERPYFVKRRRFGEGKRLGGVMILLLLAAALALAACTPGPEATSKHAPSIVLRSAGTDGQRPRSAEQPSTSVSTTSTTVATSAIGGTSATKIVSRDLTYVSCALSTNCVAVGDAYGGGGGIPYLLAAGWNGRSWRLTHPAELPDTFQDQFNAVSCSSATFCMAVGLDSRTFTSGYVPLAETWDGAKWRIVSPTEPSHGSAEAVSCTSSSFCLAVGERLETAGAVQAAWGWNGKAWQVEKAPVPSEWQKDKLGPTLDGVSCQRPDECVLVGGRSASFTASMPQESPAFVDYLNGNQWTSAVLATPANSQATIHALSCWPARGCMAVGTWAPVPGPSVPQKEEGFHALAVFASGNHAPLGGQAMAGGLSGVSCTSADTCVAVGNYLTDDGPNRSAIWRGAGWTVVPEAPTNGGFLSGVSCMSPTACVAVGGRYIGNSDDEPTSQIWNGSRWRTVPVPS